MVATSNSLLSVLLWPLLLVLLFRYSHSTKAHEADGAMITQELEMAAKGTFSYISLFESDTERLFEKYLLK